MTSRMHNAKFGIQDDVYKESVQFNSSSVGDRLRAFEYRYIRDNMLTCAQKLTKRQLNLAQGTKNGEK